MPKIAIKTECEIAWDAEILRYGSNLSLYKDWVVKSLVGKGMIKYKVKVKNQVPFACNSKSIKFFNQEVNWNFDTLAGKFELTTYSLRSKSKDIAKRDIETHLFDEISRLWHR